MSDISYRACTRNTRFGVPYWSEEDDGAGSVLRPDHARSGGVRYVSTTMFASITGTGDMSSNSLLRSYVFRYETTQSRDPRRKSQEEYMKLL